MSHRYPLAASGWSLWRWACVRGAGFPAERASRLAAPEVAAATDRLLDRERDHDGAIAHAIAAVEADLESHSDGAKRRAIAPCLRRLRAGDVPASGAELTAASTAAIAALRTSALARDDARAAAATILASEHQRVAGALRELARDPRYREALVWQNRRALHDGVDVLLRQPEGATSSKTRQHERLVANHVQRYCLKNETIGFFGPVGWATLAASPPAVAVQPGARLLAERTVYFEHWGIDALAGSLAQDPALLRHVAPRRHPFVWLDGTTLHHAVDRTTELPLPYARLLAACDGRRSARAIALELVADPALDLAGEDEVYELLDAFVAKRLVIWTLEIPPHVEHPDRELGALLDAIEDREVAAPAAAKLADLQAARDDVARAAGDAAALDRAFQRLEDTFTRLTGAPATRRHGAHYAGRTLVYEDCRRDLQATIGPDVVDRLAGPLALLLGCARWYTFTLAQRYRETFVALHRELADATGSPAVDFLRFWERASDHFSVDGRTAPALVKDVTGELQRRWAQLVGLDGVAAQRRVQVSVDQLAPAARVLFAAPCPGWPSARHHSPDLMIAARSVDAIARGDFELVAGELHVACATITAPWMVRQHPRIDDVLAAMHHDRPSPIIEAVAAKDGADRSNLFSLLPDDLELELGGARSRRPRDHVLEAGSLRVEPAERSLRVRSRDGAFDVPIELLLDSFLTNECAAHFKWLPPAAHTPRITLDGLVVARESWRFDAAQLELARAADPLERMLATRRWARAHGLPRYLFYKVPQETKPCFLDLESPLYVEQLAYLARKAPELQVSEMLPTVDEVWLPDADGQRYTCELRVVAVDPEPWRSVP